MLVLAPDPNQPQHGSLPVITHGREGLVNLLHKNIIGCSMLQPFWIVIGRCKITTQVGVRILKSAQWSYICTWHSWCWDLSLSTCYCLRAKNATVLYPSVDNVLVTWTPSEGSLQRQSALRHCRRQASTTAEWHSIVPVGIDTKFKPCISLTLHLLFCDFELFQLHRQWPSTLIGKIQL